MNEFDSSPPDISQQSDYTVLQISQEAIQNCDTSEYVTLLHEVQYRGVLNVCLLSGLFSSVILFNDDKDEVLGYSLCFSKTCFKCIIYILMSLD